MGGPLTAATGFVEAVAGFATGVVVLTVRDGRDDLGTTVTSFMSVSLDPPLVVAGVTTSSYLTEVLLRQSRWAATVLASEQRALAGRFAAEGRPSARILLASAPHHRGPRTDALVPDGGVAALECATRQTVEAGDHTLFVAEVLAADYITRDAKPLVRVNRRYLT
ncbi:flavin reductase (DIM6/NTAB) family NADH-FMN oxidoreductase RutF [Actinomadura pelletieri DSM 43383]|uniref:Flavin reductase (DIM6/NTAB) family NADH-FMN oxidoreductase RutF n=1 Tax=Actinomadura pelletieri DSM 43383 TaxID=1120940 RepID=A0A495QI00_9ACTN|nr:flavin reductase family protein [Actinomadura pelletieri]RKS71634.1 flavin reductase (DIM6/NTAB) family NADH-FMN oxidoreductase RutF [Actinomadura pelletieri DSM 43383]